MHIGILQTGHIPEALAEEHGDYDAMFPRLLANQGLEFTNYAVVDGVFPDSATAHDGWLITGSRHGAYEDHPWIPPLEELIRDAFAARVPLVGICFGHQIIAQALGGTVEKFKGGWAVGRQSYDFEDGTKAAVLAWHQDQVTKAPANARTVATSAFCEHAALVYDDEAGDEIAFSLQPHPEFRPDYLRDLIEVRGRGLVDDHLLDVAAETADQPIDSQPMADRIAAFFHAAHARRTGTTARVAHG